MGGLLAIRRESPEKEANRRQQVQDIVASSPTRIFLMGVLAATINFDAIAVFSVGVKQVAVADVSTG